MRIAHKLMLCMAIPAALIWGVAFYATAEGQNSLRQAIERVSVIHARAIMDQIDRSIHNRIAQWYAYTHRALVRDSLVASNRAFEQNTDRRGYIDQQDRLWRAVTGDTLTPLAESIMANDLSRTCWCT